MPSADDGTRSVPATLPFGKHECLPHVDVTVCIVNWNCRDLLKGCLRSLLHLPQGVRLEVIVVDNASTDGAAEMVASEFPAVQLVRNARNAGFARANNQAAALARGRLLFFLNNDTAIPPGTLAKLAAFLDRQPAALVVGPRLRDGAGKVQASCRKRPTIATFLHRTLLLRWTGLFRKRYEEYRGKNPSTLAPTDADVLMGAALMMRRADFQALGGWDEDFTFGGEDLELCLRANRLGRVVYLPDVEITHYGRASTRQHPAYAAPHIAAGFVKYFRKAGASRLGLFFYKLVLTLDVPLQLAVRGAQFVIQSLFGRQRSAERSRNALGETWSFLRRGLIAFWRS
ncbi:MAG: glycosyltransferase family 2 protein [Gemmataceae bacterium]|nr:glycosyltransferase family 2 protein [Gemmataceae bacterium]MCI0740626.1 glycosyltransferase family 2 protein [Gemmataceae bacterium]